MTRWEYRIGYPNIGGSGSSDTFPQMTDAWLNQLGADGWELVSIALVGMGAAHRPTLVFKRPKS